MQSRHVVKASLCVGAVEDARRFECAVGLRRRGSPIGAATGRRHHSNRGASGWAREPFRTALFLAGRTAMWMKTAGLVKCSTGRDEDVVRMALLFEFKSLAQGSHG